MAVNTEVSTRETLTPRAQRGTGERAPGRCATGANLRLAPAESNQGAPASAVVQPLVKGRRARAGDRADLGYRLRERCSYGVRRSRTHVPRMTSESRAVPLWTEYVIAMT